MLRYEYLTQIEKKMEIANLFLKIFLREKIRKKFIFLMGLFVVLNMSFVRVNWLEMEEILR